MLPHHQPIVVAEQFLMLEALYPGRIDLGVGRSLGFTEPVRRALRQQDDDAEQFAADIEELRSFLGGEAPVTARPVAESPPEVFLLATGQGIATAARLGLPVVIGGQSFTPRSSGHAGRVSPGFPLFASCTGTVGDHLTGCFRGGHRK